MNFTLLTTLALGGLTALTQTIITLTAWVTGSVIIPGNMFWDNTSVTNSEYVGIQQTVKHTAAGYDFITNGTQSGIVLKLDGLTRIQTFAIPCTATGGAAAGGGYYDTCIGPIPFSTSGAITSASFECGSAQLAIAASGGVVRGVKQVVTAARGLSNMANQSVGTGGRLSQFSGSTIMTRAGDSFKISTHTTIAKTSTAPDCKVFVSGFDQYGK